MPFFRASKNRPAPTHDPADGFSDVAHASGARSAYVEQWSLPLPWAIRYPGSTHAVMHCMIQGNAVVEGLADAPVPVPEGGVLLLPRDVPHTIASSLPLDDHHVIEHDGELPRGTVHNYAIRGAAQARLLTLPYSLPGRDETEPPPSGTGPDHAVFPRPEADVLEIVLLASKLALLPGVGDRYVACRLAEAVLAKVLARASGASDDRFGLFGMFASLGVRSALKAIEGDVAHGWTLGELAEIAGVPRSAFKAEFQSVMGISVSDYVGLRRLRRCESLVSDGMTAVADAASEVGFRSRASLLSATRRFGRG